MIRKKRVLKKRVKKVGSISWFYPAGRPRQEKRKQKEEKKKKGQKEKNKKGERKK